MKMKGVKKLVGLVSHLGQETANRLYRKQVMIIWLVDVAKTDTTTSMGWKREFSSGICTESLVIKWMRCLPEIILVKSCDFGVAANKKKLLMGWTVFECQLCKVTNNWTQFGSDRFGRKMFGASVKFCDKECHWVRERDQMILMYLSRESRNVWIIF